MSKRTKLDVKSLDEGKLHDASIKELKMSASDDDNRLKNNNNNEMCT